MAQKPLLDYLETLPDPRLQAKCSHVLSEVVFMATCAMMCGFDTWSEITLFAKEREQWFRRWLSLPGGVPSHDTFNRVFAILPPDSLKSIFQEWVSDILDNDTLSGQLAIDGKALRATAKGKGANPVHMVNAWSTELGMCIGQQKVDQKSNEITAIPALLKLLELEGCLVSIDAAGTQMNTVDTILKKSADYLLAVKDNQPTLSAEVQARFQAYWDSTTTDTPGPGFSEQFDAQHGRKEHRRCWTLAVDEHLPICQTWKAKTIIAVQAERVNKGKGHDFVRFYISSRTLDANLALKATRLHWSVENLLHWTLDIAFDEDRLQARVGHAGENLAVIRQWILNMLKRNTSRTLSMENKRKLCCLNDDYLLESMGLFKL
ncbi:ISAs1 family transposase [Zobellella denitrificans]|uniref:ISAs1 family transposase n=1 Tax=Zobellella denitrificans TaxID=347534 RepID=UPI000B8C3868|nr:ISAs1 family transposase [Zobellella denitrificans]OXS13542.1 ISAs1 family transposase [Zobellella denitrificans]